jgi:hypothetical protein
VKNNSASVEFIKFPSQVCLLITQLFWLLLLMLLVLSLTTHVIASRGVVIASIGILLVLLINRNVSDLNFVLDLGWWFNTDVLVPLTPIRQIDILVVL